MAEPFIVLNPAQESIVSSEKAANRLTTLDDKVLAVVNNGKRNSDVILQTLLAQIKQRYNLKDVIWIDKKNPSLPVTDVMLEQLQSSHAVIAGVGD
ncbi:hypothetical protein J2Z37_000889 [Ammoniphilus resinae]|nr:hypothetical protein [Ammoniphilus resinae]MBP1930892.1 hypothetical protein [Ammoniphilus resinae]